MKHRLPGSLKALPLAAALTAGISSAAIADPIPYAAPIATTNGFPFLQVYNERNGIGRTFHGLEGDRIVRSANVFPSPDSDAFPFTFAGQEYITTNGGSTTVAVNPGGAGGSFFPTFFIGLTSGLGGSYGEYIRRSQLLSTLSSAQLTFLDNNPVQFRISNPLAGSGPTSITLTGPDYDPAAMPAFINNISISGGGLNPTLNWVLPTGTEGLNSFLSIRKLEGTVDPLDDDPFSSSLIARPVLAPGTTSYTIDNADFNDFPGINGLVTGGIYEVAVQLMITDDHDPALPFVDPGAPHLSTVRGVSRTFFEFTPLANDVGDIAVFLPSVDAEGVYHFDFEVTEETPVVIDPIIAIGYDYQIGAGDTVLFNSVTLPTVAGDDGFFDIYLWNGASFEIFVDEALAGTEYSLGDVDRFRVQGIDAAAMLDPSDVTAFLTTLTFTGNGRFTGTMTPLTEDVPDARVPEPMTLSLLGAGLAGLGWARRRRA